MGLKVYTQSKLWQFEPAAEKFYDGSSSVVYGDGLWSVGSDSDQPIILEAFSDSGIVTFTVLNPMDGSAIAKNTFEVNKGDASYWMQISGWDGARIYLEMDAGLWLFDTQTRSKVAD